MEKRNRFFYWLQLEGIDPVTARTIERLDNNGLDPLKTYPDLTAQIDRAYDGWFCFTEGC